MKNYRNIRQEPYLFGFNVKAFFFFVLGSIMALMSFMAGFSFAKMLIVSVLILLLYGFCKYVLSNDKFISKIMDNKLPKQFSEYE
jgi:phosphotransferase system  glucose/maltose/N-acetylglucosamine-specific IIC component